VSKPPTGEIAARFKLTAKRKQPPLQGLRGDGARRIRTADLLGAMQAALSALPLVLMGRITDETSRVQGQRLSLRVEDGDRELFDRAATPTARR
jgi:hypothetical protein